MKRAMISAEHIEPTESEKELAGDGFEKLTPATEQYVTQRGQTLRRSRFSNVSVGT